MLGAQKIKQGNGKVSNLVVEVSYLDEECSRTLVGGRREGRVRCQAGLYRPWEKGKFYFEDNMKPLSHFKQSRDII